MSKWPEWRMLFATVIAFGAVAVVTTGYKKKKNTHGPDPGDDELPDAFTSAADSSKSFL